MLGNKLASKVLSEAVRHSTADETEVILRGGKLFSSRFANNYIYQNGVQKDYVLTVRVAFGDRVGMASCNIFDGDNLKQVVEDACSAARFSQPDREWVPVPEPQAYPDFPQAYFDDTMAYTPEEKAGRLQPILEASHKQGMKAAGLFSNGDGMVAVMNSRGLFAYHSYTTASFTLTTMTEAGGSGWAEFHSPDVRELELGVLAQQAMDKAIQGNRPEELLPGEYTVILEPTAVSSLVEFLVYLGCGGLAFHEGRSFTSGRLGEKLFSDKVTLRDDAAFHAVLGLPFDLEGCPKSNVVLVENGVLKQVAHNRRTARLVGTHSTGHALMPPTMEALPTNVILEPGQQSLAEMIAGTERGIYVTRFWYDNIVDQKQAITTGMSRDGTFLIENGRLTRPVCNMRYNQSLVKAFNQVEAVGNTLHGINTYFGKVAVPALKIRQFHFTGVSHE